MAQALAFTLDELTMSFRDAILRAFAALPHVEGRVLATESICATASLTRQPQASGDNECFLFFNAPVEPREEYERICMVWRLANPLCIDIIRNAEKQNT